MPKTEKKKLNLKERVEDQICDLSLSELSEVPVREIASFKRVNQLDLSSNRLITLGKNFTTLTRLVKLDLSKNQIRFLPEDFGLLEQLRHLDLYDNRLEHIPLSFGQLRKLRYLDLKGNPLSPAWEKIVGRCLTTKDCQDAAKKTVSVCIDLKIDLAAKEKVIAEAAAHHAAMAQQQQQTDSSANATDNATATSNRKSNKKSNKNKTKKLSSSPSSGVHDNELSIKEVNVSNNQKLANNKPNNKRKTSNGTQKKRMPSTRAAFTSLMTFLILLAVNICIIYMIMFKNPEIADKLIEYIPPQYRDWILTKTEFYRMHVSDWISQYRTPPEEH